MMAQRLKLYSGKVNAGLKTSGEAAKDGANAIYSSVMNHPKAATAVVLGAGAAAALLWLANRSGTFQSARKQVLARVRRAPARSRRARAA